MMVWGLTTILLLTGAALLWRGLRGKRLNNHPICRRCKFDLVGLSEVALSGVAQLSELCATRSTSQHPQTSTSDNSPSTHSSESCATANRCPECGRDLQRKRAVRYGARQKRPIAITAGALLLLICAGVGGAWGWGRATSFNWNTIKPVWLLKTEAMRGSPATIEAALVELLARESAGTLDRATHMELVERGMIAQQDMNTKWIAEWGDLIERAWEKKILSDEEFDAFARNAAVMWFLSDPSSTPIGYGRPDDPGPFHIGEPANLRFGIGGRAGHNTRLFVRPTLKRVTIDDEPVEASLHFHQHTSLAGSGGFGSPNFKTTIFDKPGVRIVRSEWIIKIFAAPQSRQGTWGMVTSATDDNGDPIPLSSGFIAMEQRLIGEETIILEGPIEVLPPRAAHAVKLVVDPALRDVIKSSITLQFRDMERASTHTIYRLIQRIEPVPIAVSFDVILSDGQRDWQSISFTQRADERTNPAQFQMAPKREEFDFTARRADIILRPNPKAVELEVGFEEIWGEEIIFRDVEIGWANNPPPAP